MRTLYLDASAITKLLVAEPASETLRAEVRESTLVTSRVAVVEVAKAVARVTPAASIEGALESFVFVELDADLATAAAGTGGPLLRALDAIHVASARLFGDELDAFVTYDARQAQAATVEGLRVISPGQPMTGRPDMGMHEP